MKLKRAIFCGTLGMFLGAHLDGNKFGLFAVLFIIIGGIIGSVFSMLVDPIE